MSMRAWRRASMVLAATAALALGAGCAGVTLPWQARSDALTASGTLEADETIIAARVSGAIEALPVREGETVQSGTLLVRIDDRQARLAVRQAVDPAARQTFELQAQDFELRSPLDGIVTRVAAHVGEIAFPGAPLLAVADLSRLDLTLYVPLSDLDRVRVGQTLEVRPDSDPPRTFRGTVTAVNQQAEFTPRNVQTRADRLNLVFGVRAQVENADGYLKPGMPIEATFVAAAR